MGNWSWESVSGRTLREFKARIPRGNTWTPGLGTKVEKSSVSLTGTGVFTGDKPGP